MRAKHNQRKQSTQTYTNSDHEHKIRFEEFLEFIKREMDFVLITEYMDESLVLLKRQWCWDLKDILYLPAKVST